MNLTSLPNNSVLKITALIMLAISVKLFLDQRKTGYKGVYNHYNSYSNISALKHDMTKVLFTEVFPILAFGVASGQKLWNSQTPLDSWFGKTIIYIAGYFIFYELIQPYVINKLPYW